ncbi:MAG TPA: tetratricopeptide repeat protein, partial [bacterium]
QDYIKAIKISPDYAAAYYNLGIVFWTLKKWKDVVTAWEKSLALNPDQSYIIEYLPKAKLQARRMR